MRKGYHAIWIGVLYCISLGFFLFQGGKSSLMLFIILNILLLYIGAGYFSGIRKVSGERKVKQQSLEQMNITANSPVTISLEIKLRGIYPVPYINIEETLVRHNGESLKFEGSLVPDYRNYGVWHYEIPSLKRGEYQFTTTKCTTYDAFGLLPHHGTFNQPTQINVMPVTTNIEYWDVLMKGNRGKLANSTSQKQIRESNEQAGIRDYIYGDRLSRVHWNATAKTGHWKSKDFEREALPKTIVVLDRHESPQSVQRIERHNQFELAVSVSASLLQDGMRKGAAIGLLSCGPQTQYFNPKSGKKQFVEIMRHLTTVDCDEKKPLSELLRHMSIDLAPNSLIMLVTSGPVEQLQATLQQLMQKGHIVTVFYIASPATATPPELLKLKQRGHQIYMITSLKSLSYIAEGSGVG